MDEGLFRKNFQSDKRRILHDHGYTNYEQFIRDKDKEGLSVREIADIFDMTDTSMCHEFRLLGMSRGPRGGRNNWVIPEWGIEEIASYKKLTTSQVMEYACMFLCSPVTVRLCHSNTRKRRGLR